MQQTRSSAPFAAFATCLVLILPGMSACASRASAPAMASGPPSPLCMAKVNLPRVCRGSTGVRLEPGPGQRLYRLTVLPSFPEAHGWIIVTLEIDQSGGGRLTSGTWKAEVSAAEALPVEQSFTAYNLAAHPVRQFENDCLDSTEWTVESMMEGEYRAVTRDCGGGIDELIAAARPMVELAKAKGYWSLQGEP